MNKNKLLKTLTSPVVGATLVTMSILPFVLTTNDNSVTTTLNSVTDGNEFYSNTEGYAFYDGEGTEMSSSDITGDGKVHFIVNTESNGVGEVSVGSDMSQTEALTGPLNLPSTVKHDVNGNDDFDDDSDITYTVVEIRDRAFLDKHSITNLTLPRYLKTIGPDAFYGCDDLAGELVIPDTLMSIGTRAFTGCSGLTGKLVIPDGVKSIGGSAFSGCSGFTGDLVIPGSVKIIDENAFEGCVFDRTIVKKGDLSTFKKSDFPANSFEEIGGILYTYCLDSATDEKIAFGPADPEHTGKLSLEKDVTKIADSAFLNSNTMTGDLLFSDNVIFIGANAFSGCSQLTSVSWWTDEQKTYTFGTDLFPTTNPGFKIYSNNPSKLNGLENVEQIKVNVDTTTTSIVPNTETKIGNAGALTNSQIDGIVYDVKATYVNFPGDLVPSNAFQIRNGNEIWYTNVGLKGDVNLTVQARLSNGTGYAVSDPIVIDYLLPEPVTPTNLQTIIIGNAPSVIGVFKLEYYTGNVNYSITSAKYINGGIDVADDVFKINASTGTLLYNGTELTGNVQIIVNATDANGKTYNFNPVNLSYYPPAPSPINPDESDLNTSIVKGEPSTIGTFKLKNPVGDTVYETYTAKYVNSEESVPANAFDIDSSTGILSYDGTELIDDVKISVVAINDKEAHFFNDVILNYRVPSCVNVAAAIGGTVGGVAAAGLGGGAAFYFVRKKK